MLIWAILALSFAGGIVVIAKGDLKTSKRRHIVGRAAKLIGVAMIGLPFIVVAAIYFVVYVSHAIGSDAETSRTYGTMFGVLLISAMALLLGMNLKRLSVPIAANGPRPDLSGLTARSGKPDFSALEDRGDSESSRSDRNRAS